MTVRSASVVAHVPHSCPECEGMNGPPAEMFKSFFEDDAGVVVIQEGLLQVTTEGYEVVVT